MSPLLRTLITTLFFFATGTLRAEVDGHTLLKFQREAEAVNAEKAEANRYRVGFYYGYINGVLDALNSKSVCFSECRCELDKPAGPTLSRLFERNYPCKKQ